MPAEDETFGALVGELDYPMLIVTASDAEEQSGCLVGFATQASIDPPRYAVYLSDKNRTYRVAQRAEYLGVHFVPDDADDLARLFGGETGDEIDKFERVDWRPGVAGTPLLDRCGNRFVGRVLERRPAGDHVMFLLEPVDASHEHPVRPFPFHRAKRLEPGHEA
ncbi:MAG TPA: flavin reductase family protein [Solirubrobacterales bacterium]|nr:flavin reductase family protein [Solirubrobacterales bacterium]